MLIEPTHQRGWKNENYCLQLSNSLRVQMAPENTITPAAELRGDSLWERKKMETRPSMLRCLRVGAVALLGLGAGLAQAQFKCVDAKGGISIQQLPCPQGEKQTQLDTRYEPAPEPAPRPAPAGRSVTGSAPTSARTGLAPSGRPCKTAAEYAEIQKELAAKLPKQRNSNEPGMETARMLFGDMDKRLAEEMKACL